MTFVCDKHYMQGTIVVMAAKNDRSHLNQIWSIEYIGNVHALNCMCGVEQPLKILRISHH